MQMGAHVGHCLRRVGGTCAHMPVVRGSIPGDHVGAGERRIRSHPRKPWLLNGPDSDSASLFVQYKQRMGAH